MKRFLLLSVILITLLVAVPVTASTITGATYYGTVRVSNNSTATTDVSVPITNLSSPDLIAAGFANAGVTNIAIRNSSGNDVPFMPGYTSYPWCGFFSDVPASNTDYTLYSGNVSGGKMRYFPAINGATASDAASLEVSSNFTQEIAGFVDITASGNITAKQDAYTLVNNGDGTITANIHDYDWSTPSTASGWTDSTSACDNTTSSYATVDVSGTAWSAYLTFTVATGNISQVRYWYEREDSDITQCLVDVYDGSWNNVYSGVPGTEDEWVTHDITDYDNVSQVRLKFWNQNVGVRYVRVYELQSYIQSAATLLSVTASGIVAAEQEITVNLGTRPDFDDFSTITSIGMPFGGGMLPVILLDEVELAAVAGSVNFTDINTMVSNLDSALGITSRHLVVMVNAQSSDAGTYQVSVQFNSDTGSNYNWQYIQGQSSTASANRATSTTAAYPFWFNGTTYTNAVGGGNILIPNAFNTSNHKVMISYGGASEDILKAETARWASTSAITSITLTAISTNFNANSDFQLGVIDERYLVEEIDLSGSDTDATFSGIAGTSSNLAVIGYARTDRPLVFDIAQVEFNGDTTSTNYNIQQLQATGSSNTTYQLNRNDIGQITGASASANQFGVFCTFINQYSEAANDTPYLALSGYHDSSGPNSVLHITSARWDNTAAITQVAIVPETGPNFVAGSLFSLYRVPQYYIDRVYLTEDTASITFSDIPQGYEALQLLLYARTDAAATADQINHTLNADTTAANYDRQRLYGSGASVGASRSTASQNLLECSGDSAGANEFSGGIVTYYNYSATDRHKHIFWLGGVNEDTAEIRSMRWESTSAITTILLEPVTGSNFLAGTVAEIVGIMPYQTLSIAIDDDVYAIDDANGATAPDNSNDWNYLANYVMPYMEYHRLYVGGNLVQDIDWEYAAAFTDDSGNSNTWTPTLRQTSSDADVSAALITFSPLTVSEVTGDAALDWSSYYETPDEPESMYTEEARPGIFFEPLVHSVWSITDLPDSFFWYNFCFLIIIVSGMVLFRFFAEKNIQALLIKSLVMAVIMVGFALPGPNVYGMYVVLYFALWCFGIMVVAKSWSW